MGVTVTDMDVVVGLLCEVLMPVVCCCCCCAVLAFRIIEFLLVMVRGDWFCILLWVLLMMSCCFHVHCACVNENEGLEIK